MQFNHWSIIVTITLITGFILIANMAKLLPPEKAPSKLQSYTDGLPFLVYLSKAWFPLFFIFLLIFTLFFSISVDLGVSNMPTIYNGEVEVGTYYDAKFPLSNLHLFNLRAPKRGQMATLRWPIYTKHLLTKRIIGMPGDSISYVKKVLYINEEATPLKLLRKFSVQGQRFEEYEETIGEFKHRIYIKDDTTSMNFYHLKVPEGQFFVMGDNRDFSYDSRDWGFVPRENLVESGGLIVWSYDKKRHQVRWNRLFTRVQ